MAALVLSFQARIRRSRISRLSISEIATAATSQGQGSRARSSTATLRRDDRSACEEPERYFRGWYLSIGSAGVWLLLQFRRGRVPAASNGEGGENQWNAQADPG